MSIIKPKGKIQNLKQPCHEHKVTSDTDKLDFSIGPFWWESDWAYRLTFGLFILFILGTYFLASS